MPPWTGADGWPQDFPHGLIEAISSLPGAGRVSREQIEGTARLLMAVADGAMEEELPRAQLASSSATDRELERLHLMCVQLADHIECMHEPAVTAIHREMVGSIFSLVQPLKQAAESARHAFGASDAPEQAGGRPRKVAATEVTGIAAQVFEDFTGLPATYTSDPATSQVRGLWPDFLSRILRALLIQASVASQVKAHKSKKPKLTKC